MLASILAIITVMPVLPSVPAAAAPTFQALTAASDPVADGSMTEEDKALADAQASGQPVEVVSARTESSDTWAQPDGSFSVKHYGSAVRVWRNRAWVPVDPTLVFAADGSVVPRAAAVSVRFSGGGTGPMLTGIRDGRSLSLTWPRALPTPALAGNVATYAEVLPGVDLQLKAEVEGFSQLLVVKNAQAAQNPELAQLQFAIGTVGLKVTKDSDTGSLEATDPAGQAVFTSPTPMMWDSSHPSGAPAVQSSGTRTQALPAALTTDDSTPAGAAFDPGAGAQDAALATSVSQNTLTLTPQQDLLTGANTTYPVYIDPTWSSNTRTHWARVYQAYPYTSFWDAKDVVRVGYEAETGGLDRISRSFFELDTSAALGAQVKSATFRIRNTWSWSCQARQIQLYEVGDISRKTTWKNQPAKIGSVLDTVNDAKGWGSSCPAGNLELNATSAVRKAAADNASSVTLGMYATDETDTYGWKKFDPKTAVLEIVYNNPPKTPTSLGTYPRTSCSAGGTIGNTSVSLYAKVDDPDAGNLTADFQLFSAASATTPTYTTSVPAMRGRVATVVLPTDKTPSGTYTWRVRAKDPDGLYSSYSPTCTFTIDRARPSKPPGISSQGEAYPSGINGWPAQTGPARSIARFLLSPNGVTDVSAYYWWTDTDPDLNETSATAAWADVFIPSYGPHLVYAYSVDGAGNRSDTAVYLYYATRSTQRDEAGDLNGDGFKDIWSTDSNNTLLTHAGQGGGRFYAAANAGGSFPSQQVSLSGDWGQDGYNDLVSLEYVATTKKNKLSVYRNNGRGSIDRTEAQTLRVLCPTPTTSGPCKTKPGWSGDDHWSDAQQVTAGGDLNGDSFPDILVKRQNQLWIYYGTNYSDRLDFVKPHPSLAGGTDWDKFTLTAPGDLNGDSIPDLLLRDVATGDLYRSYGAREPISGDLDLATWGTVRTKIATGFKQADYPTLGTSGDLTGDGVLDIWARKADNTMSGWPGTNTSGQLTGLGTRFVIDGITGGARMVPGTQLTSGQSISSNSATLTMKADGNLTVTSKAGAVLWTSKTDGNAGAVARVEANGNLSVYNSNGSIKLWTTGVTADTSPNLTGEGYVLLQDKGNLVVYNAKSQALWSNGSGPRHDYDGDGRSDMAWWNDFTAGSDATYSLLTNSDGTFKDPLKSFAANAGVYEAKYMKFVTGDFNGDGRGDIAALHPFSDTSLEMLTFLGQSSGGFATPFTSWKIGPNIMHGSYMTPQAGDFNGDGRDDVAFWYAYPDGTTKLFTLTADVRGGFNKPFESWSATPGTWLRNRCKFTTGDFNGDGRDDIAVFYGQGDDTIRTHTFLANTMGGFDKPTSWWYTGSLDWDQATPHAGDFTGDGRDDIMIWYAYDDGSDRVSTMFAESVSGQDQFGSAKVTLDGKASWDIKQTQLTTGDFNGDGHDDLAALRQSNGSIQTWTWNWYAPDSTFKGGLAGWTAPATNWPYEPMDLIIPYN
ncbi:FG-GAP-like repeat-containing protein [Streptomyces longwoodensis]|uniref:FG-GAP-like repeat-containing protein n=1 Tax=Streptomyces longwoodensis TaxID=68231 RepID=UPI003406A1DD